MQYSKRDHRSTRARTSPQRPAIRIATTMLIFGCSAILALTTSSYAGDGWYEYGSSRKWDSASSPESRLTESSASPQAPELDWSIEVGDGRAQVVGDTAGIFVTSAKVMKSPQGTLIDNQIRRLDLTTGKERWTVAYQTKLHGGKQETFGNQSACPQATPLLIQDRLIAIDFSGTMVCYNTADGELLWKRDLVSDLDAIPVQFGFASSPVRVPNTEDFVVLAAGPTGGLYRFQSKTGKIRWTAKCESFSYATPVLAKIQGEDQWIIVSEQSVRGISATKGEELWRYAMPKPGLTNVPTPLTVSSDRILLSGQGCGGSRCIEIIKNSTDASLQAVEVWNQPKVQLFYTNWIQLNQEYVIGCTDGFLALLRIDDGSIAGRWRGYADGNLIDHQGTLALVGGKGALSILQLPSETSEYLIETARYSLEKGRYWTPPTVIGDRWIVRANQKLTCYRMRSKEDKPSRTIDSQLKEPKQLAITKPADPPPADPVETIFTTFQQQGQQAALELYSKLRAAKKLNVEQRIALAAAAEEQQLAPLQKLILQHAAEDFPNDARIARALADL